MLSDPSPRPPRCYDPSIAPYRDGEDSSVVHVHDYATIRALLRDPVRVTADVSETVSAEDRERLHPVSAFVWATDRRTMSGCPGRHAALRTAMASWFTASAAAARRATTRSTAEALVPVPGWAFDVYHDYAVPVVFASTAEWLGVTIADVTYAVADQISQGEFFDHWPMLSTEAMDEHYRALMARPRLSGVAAETRELVAKGVLTEREAWGIIYSLSVSTVATAAAVTLAAGLSVEHGLWERMADPAAAAAAVEEAIRIGNPFPQASRFVREPFQIGDVAVEPGDQVLMWLTAANRELPGPQTQPLDRFDPERDNTRQLGFGSGYHLCGGVHHVREVAVTAVTTLAERCPQLRITAPWKRFVGIDDGYLAAPAESGNPPIGLRGRS
jgi:pikromycin synthase